jgi:NADH-quinone oxidoreductase subunit G
MPKIIIDEKEIEVEDGLTIIAACDIANIEIPRFCYHEKLAIAGNCRMCLVEVEKAPKLVASCAMPVTEGMVIRTNSKKVEEARKSVMEFLLINHPLDCPICDQGGECDLQDQAYKYGNGASRFHENKRSVEDKDFGPLIQTHMTRCIHCARCVRFAEDIAGTSDLGITFRGEEAQVESYVKGMLKSEISGNIIDLCPVGALTSKPYEFKARNWELKKTESIDVLDSMCSNIRIDSMPFEVMRILPKRNDYINEEWISDKTRFAYDGLKYQRLDRAYVRDNGRLQEVDTDFAINKIVDKLSITDSSKIAAVSGLLSDCESIFMLKKLMNAIKCDNLAFIGDEYGIDKNNYLFNSSIDGIEKADICLLIGVDLRNTLPVLNARVRKSFLENNLAMYSIGDINDQTYPVEILGSNPSIISEILNKQNYFSKILEKAKRPMIIIGNGVYRRNDSRAILSKIHEMVEIYPNLVNKDEGWNGLNVLHTHSGPINALEIGFYSSKSKLGLQEIKENIKSGKINLVYLLEADEFEEDDFKGCFVIYHGHHGDKGAQIADIIIPSSAYTEKNSIYINLEGRAQETFKAIDSPRNTEYAYKLILQIMHGLNLDCKLNDLDGIRKEMSELIPSIKNLEKIIRRPFIKFTHNDNIIQKEITIPDSNFYMTDIISKNSQNMARAYKARLSK